MLKSILRLTPAAAGLFTACLLSACGDDPKPEAPECEKGDEDCESAKDPISEKDGGKPPAKDAGKDAGKDASKPPATVDAGALAKIYLPCDVHSIVEEKCGSCHGEDPTGKAPSLVSAMDFQADRSDKQKMYAMVKDKILATDPRNAMPPPSADNPLTEAEKETLSAWLTKGAPGVDKACAVTPEKDKDSGVEPAKPWDQLTDDDLECHKLLASNGDGKTPMTVGSASDVYFAFVYALPWKDTSYGVIIRSIIDNKKALHHWLLFQDLAPQGPGGPIPQIGAHPTGQLIAAWAPGADDMDFRKLGDEVALELPANTTYTLEFHYNSGDPSAKDASGVEICVAKTKPKNIAAYSWLGFDNTGFPSTQWTGTCRPTSQEPIHIVSFMPHMHLQGIHMKGTVNRKDGTKEVVHDKPFDFNFQRSYATNVTINPGDTITTVCDYATPSVFGQPTSAEMCYLFAMAYPKGALASPDLWGTVAHGASACLGQ